MIVYLGFKYCSDDKDVIVIGILHVLYNATL